MPPRVPPEKWEEYDRLRNKLGISRADAARRVQIDYRTALKRDREHLGIVNGRQARETRIERRLPDVLPAEKLCPQARRALDDFGYFRRRYFGRISRPWQEEAAYVLIQLLDTPHKEYVVINCPPGSGKSTLFTHDIPAWMICRNRAMRLMIGSRTKHQAEQYAYRLKKSFERVMPPPSKADEIALGLAVDAEASLAVDFGRFKPLVGDVWRRDMFTVAQADDIPIEEKEATVTAYGMDSGFLGGRFKFVIWDDLVDRTTMRTAEAIESQQIWWGDEAETRLEPAGVLCLQGQRMGPSDLYRHCLDMPAGEEPEAEEDDEGEIVGGEADRPRKYRHIIFRAHYEDRCESRHKTNEAPFPDGCLLDPKRLPWRELKVLQANRADKYRVLYQQEDLDPASVLVNPIWIRGGTGADGSEHPGCWDNDRDLCELPQGLLPPFYSIATADPSPTKMWSVQWWVYAPEASNQAFLMDLERRPMSASEFLDWNANTRSFFGLMEDWQARSVELNIPITTWVVEINAAQRFLLAYDHVKRWQAKWGVDIRGHSTTMRKLDPEYGPQIIAPHFKYGRIRLPGMQAPSRARYTSMKLVDEVTRWPEGRTDDCVMACWFLFANLPDIALQSIAVPRLWRPSWMRRTG